MPSAPRADRRGYDNDHLREVAEAHEQARTRLYTAFERAMRQEYQALSRRVLDVLRRRAAAHDGVRWTLASADDVAREIDPGDFGRRLGEAALGPSRFGILLGGQFEGGLAMLDARTYPWTEGMDAMNRYAAAWAQGQRYIGVAERTRGEYVEAVRRTIAEGRTWPETLDALEERFAGITRRHAAAIADTETTRLFNAGGAAFRTEYGIPYKQWVCSFWNSRDTHIAAHGQRVREGEEFRVGRDRMQFPGAGSLPEENINCHCVVIGVGAPSVVSTRVERARLAYRGLTKDKERLATESEEIVARVVKGRRMPDNHPIDVTRPQYAFEVKTITPDSTRDRVDMRRDCRERKLRWVKENRARGFTIARDLRGGGDVWYYREGFGAFALGAMTRLQRIEDLPRVLGIAL